MKTKIDKRAAAIATGVLGGLVLFIALFANYPVVGAASLVALGAAGIWFGTYILARRP